MRLIKPLNLIVIVLGITVLLSSCSNKQQVIHQANLKPSGNKVEPVKDNTTDVRDYNDIVKTGLTAQQNDWIYYMDYKHIGSGNLYRIKADGENNRQVIYETFDDVKVVGDWIYYLSDYEHGLKIYKVKLDGSGKTLLVDSDFKKDKDGNITLNSNVASFDVVDDTIYFSFSTNKPDKASKVALYSIKTDGTGKTKIIDWALNVYVKEGWIYYKDQEDHSNIYKVKLDGSEKTKLVKAEANNFIIVDDWIYYTDIGIAKVKIDGTGNQLIYNGQVDLIVNANNEWVYFCTGASSEGIYKIKNAVNPNGTKPMFVKPF